MKHTKWEIGFVRVMRYMARKIGFRYTPRHPY